MAAIERRLTKNEKRRLKEKKEKEEQKQKQEQNDQIESKPAPEASPSFATPSNENLNETNKLSDLDYTSSEDSELLSQYSDIFSKFSKPEELLDLNTEKETEKVSEDDTKKKKKDRKISDGQGRLMEELQDTSDEDEDEKALSSDEAEEKQQLSKKKQKLLNRLKIHELKQQVEHPELVETHDVSSRDPHLLLYLKALPASVPVPRHWSYIRKYLQAKKGIEKKPYQLPSYIEETGITKLRQELLEEEEKLSVKQKARGKIRPKMSKVDIDYQVLYEAFFKHQTPPPLTYPGDLYYEGKEFEVQSKEKKPGQLSDQLKEALHMTNPLQPPPWLLPMQRYGPPPSYPSLLIPGLNAPLPPGATYGYHPGGWGKPPVDEYGQPLYGNPFDTPAPDASMETKPEVDNSYWGVVQDDGFNQFFDEPEEEEEEEEITEEPKKELINEYQANKPEENDDEDEDLSVNFDIRKRNFTKKEEPEEKKELYRVLQEEKISGSTSQIFHSDKIYKLNPATASAAPSSVIPGMQSEDQALKKKKLEAINNKMKDFKF